MADESLFADFYELKMMQAYLEEGMTDEATFSLYVRRLPPNRNYLVACGLGTVLQMMETFRFSSADIAYLKTLGQFSGEYLKWLRRFRFTGSVFAMPEGTPFFQNEPVLEVVAPLPEAQLFETLIMNQVHLQVLMASKASRVVAAAQGRPVVDFGARRIHGIDAALKAARAFHVAGVAATSNLAAARRLSIPPAGTMAHSYVQAHDRETQAFSAFLEGNPGATLLIDTYDTADAARIIAYGLDREATKRILAVRLDSGDLLKQSREVRHILDSAGLQNIKIMASGGLDETEISRLVRAQAPIDSFGVGTSMGVSADAPALDIAYKLTEYAGVGRMKLASGKSNLPGRKQVYRQTLEGRHSEDTIALAGEILPGRPLLQLVMEGGRSVGNHPKNLNEIRKHARAEIDSLPDGLHSLSPAEPYPVSVSPGLVDLRNRLEEEIRRRMAADARAAAA